MGRMYDDERTYIPEASFRKIISGPASMWLIYAAIIGLALYTRSILPLLFVGLPNFYGAWLAASTASPSTRAWRRTSSITV